MPSPYPCSPVIRECLWKKTQIKKKEAVLVMSVRMKNKVKISLKNIFSGDCRDGCMQN